MTDIMKELMRKLKGKVQCRKCIHYEEAVFTYGGEEELDHRDHVSICKKKDAEIEDIDKEIDCEDYEENEDTENMS